MAENPHFKGKDALTHVIDARKKGKEIMEEAHGAPISGGTFAFCEAANEAAILSVIIALISYAYNLPILLILPVFLLGYLIWKSGRIAFLGYTKLERLHRLIEEERWEIEHSRDQERKELEELYAAKGFSGKLLDQVIDVLMADDNRLLEVMLKEELGLTLESFEHPLKEATCAFVGVIAATLLLGIGFFIHPLEGILSFAALISVSCSILSAKREKNQVFNSVIWSLGIAALAALSAYFFSQILINGIR